MRIDWIDWSDPGGMKSIAQHSYPVLQSQRYCAFKTTVNYTLLLLVRGNVGSIPLLLLLSCRSCSGPGNRTRAGYMETDLQIKWQSGEESTFLVKESTVIACL